jgi:hypothetical protein
MILLINLLCEILILPDDMDKARSQLGRAVSNKSRLAQHASTSKVGLLPAMLYATPETNQPARFSAHHSIFP